MKRVRSGSNFIIEPQTHFGCGLRSLTIDFRRAYQRRFRRANVAARSLNPAINGGLNAQARFDFALNNAGDTVYLRCNGVAFDRVAVVNGFPETADSALSLSGDRLDGFERWG